MKHPSLTWSMKRQGMSDLDHITSKPVADNRTSLDFDDRNSEPPAQPKSFPVPKLPLASLNNPVQTFQHEQQQVQFQVSQLCDDSFRVLSSTCSC